MKKKAAAEMTKKQRIIKEVISWTATILIAIVIALLLNLFIIQPHEVIGDSMLPNLHNGNVGLISKFHHTFNIMPNYKDIVVIDSRTDRKHNFGDDISDSFRYNMIATKLFGQANHIYWIKRVIGKPGDTIEIKSNKVYRNGQLLDEPYINEPMENNPDQTWNVPKDSIFVMGDNRNHSSDSRIKGCIPIRNVMGKLLIKF